MKEEDKYKDVSDGFLKTVFKAIAESIIINVVFRILLFIPRMIISIFKNF